VRSLDFEGLPWCLRAGYRGGVRAVLRAGLYPFERGFLPSALRATTKSKSERRLIT
jgi:hypothetical protein